MVRLLPTECICFLTCSFTLASHNENGPPGYPRKPGWHNSTLSKLIRHSHKTFDQSEKETPPEQQHYTSLDATLAQLVTRYIEEKKQQKLHIPQEVISVRSYLAEVSKTSSRDDTQNT